MASLLQEQAKAATVVIGFAHVVLHLLKSAIVSNFTKPATCRLDQETKLLDEVQGPGMTH
jgi:hypothetical protein